jgi:hypothetical protein
MQTYKQISGTDKLNEFVKVGWKLILAFPKQIGDSECQEFTPAFVIVWDFPSEPQIPTRFIKPQVAEPIESLPIAKSDNK